MARTRFIRLAGGGLLLAAAIQIFLTLYVRVMIYARVAMPYYNLQPLQAIVSAALLISLIALVVAQENHLGWLGYLGFGIALAGALSALVGSLMSLMKLGLNGFAFLLLLIGLLVPRDPQHDGLSALNYDVSFGIWLTSLCLCVGLSLYGLASLRARHIPRWGAGALLTVGLLQLPFVLLFVPFSLHQFALFPASVSNAVLANLWPISLATALLWGILGVALLRHARA